MVTTVLLISDLGCDINPLCERDNRCSVSLDNVVDTIKLTSAFSSAVLVVTFYGP